QTETEATGAPQKHHYTLNQQVGSITIICDLKRSLYTSMYSECIMICILKIAITYNDLFFVAQLKRICSNKCKDINA
ncbi:hypothetical protein OTU44_21775, partial [Klebsiella pneumoniae]|uniref:hypothetical protein n=1 Tax=Klebsiella pneumoniae TaxID=573 RepID=UPI002265648F